MSNKFSALRRLVGITCLTSLYCENTLLSIKVKAVKISFKNHKDLIRDDVSIRDMSHFLTRRPRDTEAPDSGDLRYVIDVNEKTASGRFGLNL